MTTNPTFDDRDDAVIDDVVSTLVENERAAAALEAENVMGFATAMRVALSRSAHKPKTVQVREMQLRSIAAEIGIALRWNDRVVQRRMNDAIDLVDKWPATLDALSEGRISMRHASVIREEGAVIDDPNERQAFEEVVLERASTDTVARTRTLARAIAEELHPESITVRHARAENDRRVWVNDVGDGIGELVVRHSITLVRAMRDRLTRQAHAVRSVAAPPTSDTEADAAAAAERDGDAASDPAPATGDASATGAASDSDAASDTVVHDTRTLDQMRADLACDLMLTGQPAIDPTTDVVPGGLGAIRAHVQVVVPALTAAGVSDRGATIDGLSPVDAETARCLMATAPGWDRILTHPVTGAVLAVDRYQRNRAMERFLAARDIHCRFPGCRMPARYCDYDHNYDWALGGPTDVINLACLCKRHHTLKTETKWTARQRPDGSIEWTSPLGHTTIDKPERYVTFVPDGDPPPF
ncbi:HNH endonuclease signature motif containing protein [Microbacterium sp. A1-JK]|uniref:HNH endonuclease signature motif containing protein n=1 Tax=Microbacterium sp. A1-JK TaxID=3177516 RepID=UPI0038882D21